MGAFTLYTSTGEVHSSTTDTGQAGAVQRLFGYDVKLTRTADTTLIRVRGREAAGARTNTYYLEHEPSRGAVTAGPPLERMLRFAEETAGVSIITDPSVADEAALLQADPTQRNDTRYPGAVGDHLQDLDTAYIEAPSYEQALGLAEHTMSVWPDSAVAVLDEADLRPMEEFDVMIAVDESLLSIQPAEETAAEVEELEREASIEAVEARFEAIQQDVRQLMLSEQVPDEEVRDRVRAMAEPVTVGESVTSTSHTGQESLLPGIPGVTPVRAALAALSTVLVFGLGVLVLALVGGENLPDISAVVPDESMATLVPGNVSPLTVGIGGAIIGVLLIALSTVISSRS